MATYPSGIRTVETGTADQAMKRDRTVSGIWGYLDPDSVDSAIRQIAADLSAIPPPTPPGVQNITTSTSNGLTTITWDDDTSGGGGGDGSYGSISWANVYAKPSTFPPSAHNHPVSQITASGTRSSKVYLRGDGTWSVPGNGAVASGACLRFYSSGVEIHTNESHANNIITGFEPYDDKGRLVIKHSAPGATILTMGAFPDETLTERGISAGMSGGVGTTRVQFAEYGEPLDLRVSADYNKIAGIYSNLWVFWLHLALGGTS